MALRRPPENADYTVPDILAWLAANGSAENLAGMARFGINIGKAFGVGNAALRPFGKTLGRNHDRALELWQTGFREARLLALFTDEPERVNPTQARHMAGDFNSWEIVDTAADLFVKARLEGALVIEFAADEREFVRRTAFAMIASAAVHLKNEPDSLLIGFLPLIEAYSTDPRNFDRKAVNWALRNIGKRNLTCHAPALALAEKFAVSNDKTTRWVGKDAVRELTLDKILTAVERKSAG